jgi:hypothetical protein
MSRCTATHDQTLALRHRSASPFSQARPHARVRAQFSTLQAAMALKSPASLERETGGQHFQFAVEGTRSGEPRIAGWRSRSPPCCVSNPLRLRRFMREFSLRPNACPQSHAAARLSDRLEALPGGPPARDPTRGWWPPKNGGLARDLLIASRDFPIQKHPDIASSFCIFFFCFRRLGYDRRG